MNIYKEDVIEALEDEPLDAGQWLSPGYAVEFGATISLVKDSCAACAVGSLIRHFLPNMDYGKGCLKAARLAKNHSGFLGCGWGYDDRVTTWLSALSSFWEDLNSSNYNLGVEEARTIVIDWVEANFPEDEILGVL